MSWRNSLNECQQKNIYIPRGANTIYGAEKLFKIQFAGKWQGEHGGIRDAYTEE